eukprot:3461510-Pleurochrysis_carterae.AAC.1
MGSASGIVQHGAQRVRRGAHGGAGGAGDKEGDRLRGRTRDGARNDQDLRGTEGDRAFEWNEKGISETDRLPAGTRPAVSVEKWRALAISAAGRDSWRRHERAGGSGQGAHCSRRRMPFPYAQSECAECVLHFAH